MSGHTNVAKTEGNNDMSCAYWFSTEDEPQCCGCQLIIFFKQHPGCHWFHLILKTLNRSIVIILKFQGLFSTIVADDKSI